MKNRNIFIGSLVTVVAAGTLGTSVVNAKFNSKTRRDTEDQGYERQYINNSGTTIYTSSSNTIEDDADFSRQCAAITTAYNARKNGNIRQADAILTDAGIMQDSSVEDMIAMSEKDAIDDNDWVSYRTATAYKNSTAIAKNESQFDAIIEARELRKQGRYQEANEVLHTQGLCS